MKRRLLALALSAVIMITPVPDANAQTCPHWIITAYSPDTPGMSSTTADGTYTRGNEYLIAAVDPAMVELGTWITVEGFGDVRAADTGGAIKGRRIDLLLGSYQEAITWGIKCRQVWW